MRSRKRPRRVEHPNLSSRGGSRAWSRMVERVVKEEPMCRLRLPGCTIRSQTADHIITRRQRPDLTMHRPNLRGACHKCNRQRGTMNEAQMAVLRGRRNSRARALGFFG